MQAKAFCACKANSYTAHPKTRHAAQAKTDLIFDWGSFTIHFNGSRKTCNRMQRRPGTGKKEAAMTNEQILAEIREANLTYLMLAQNLIRQDKAEAVFRLGMNEEAADILASLSAAQVLKLASRNTLLCSFRVDDNLVWSLLTNHTAKKVGNEATNTLHANILMASRVSEVL
jgi:flagellar transcriptional activator FlhD